MAKIKTTVLELKMLREAKQKIDLAKQRIENGKKNYQEVQARNNEALEYAEKSLNEDLSVVAGKKVKYEDVSFTEDGLEI